MNMLQLTGISSIQALYSGLFMSRGIGTHPTRMIDSHELIYVDQGSLGMREEDTAFTVKAGEALLLFPGRQHGGTVDYPSDLRFYWIHFHLRTVTAGDPCTLQQHVQVQRPERLKVLFHLFLEDQEYARKQTPARDHLLELILMEAARTSAGEANANSLAEQVRVAIALRFNQPISTSDIAHELGVHPDYLGRVFKQATGMTVTEAIHAKRLNYAIELLLHSHHNINEIADLAGFNDTGYFRRLFKRTAGSSPARYRKTFTKVHVNTV